MVFGALIEYACVGYTAKRIQLRKNRSLLAPSTIPLPARATFSQTNKTTLKYIWLLHFSLRSNMKGIQLHVVIPHVLFQILGHAEAGGGEEGWGAEAHELDAPGAGPQAARPRRLRGRRPRLQARPPHRLHAQTAPQAGRTTALLYSFKMVLMEVLVEILDSTYLLSYFASSSLKTSAQKSIEYLLWASWRIPPSSLLIEIRINNYSFKIP